MRWCSHRRRSFPRPSLRRSEPNHVAEIVQALQSLLGEDGSADSTQPIGAILRAQHQVVVAYDLRLVILEKSRQPRLELILVGDQQVATRAVPASLVQCYQLHRVNMDDQRQLTLARFASALWAGREADVGVRIQGEAVARRRLAETRL